MKIRKFNRTLRKTSKYNDFILIFLTLILIVFGVIMVFSASYYSALSKYGDAYHFLIRDGVFAVIGIAAMLGVSKIPYRVLRKFAFPFLAAVVFMLLLLFTPLGKTVNGATRWLDLKIITVMPGEFAKLAVILFTASYLTNGRDKLKKAGSVIWLMLVGGLIAGLIMLQPNMSTAVTVVLIMGSIMFVEGLSWKWIGSLLAIGGAAGAGIIIKEGGYKLQRITSFLHPFDDPMGDGYQVVQGLLAMGSGGLFGVGLGKSMQKNLYLPEPQNDFILAIIGEELGFIGIAALMVVYMLLIWRCINITLNAPDRFSMLLGSGVTAMIAIQVLFNIAIVTSSMPPTGVILPFISYGGNAMLVCCIGIGILLNISHYSKLDREE
ncbi:MAG: putative lipid II flippase FtsW [Clostridiales bacterium]|nr:putative lipid II flippase FtsW [Clostridiales bacterium]MDY5975053.1 putative lipid II flippase FtsW [Anaerovoracaceae bacterium]